MPTRSSSRSESQRRRSHSRRRGPSAVTSTAAGSGASCRRIRRSQRAGLGHLALGLGQVALVVGHLLPVRLLALPPLGDPAAQHQHRAEQREQQEDHRPGHRVEHDADGERGQRGEQRDRPLLAVLRLGRHLHRDRGRRRGQPGRAVVGQAAVVAGHQRRVRRLGRHHHQPGGPDRDHLARLDLPLLGQRPALQPGRRRLLVRPPAHRLRGDQQPGLPGGDRAVGHVGVGVVRAAEHELAQRQPVHPAGVRAADHPHLGDAADVGVVHAEADRAAEPDDDALAERADRHRQRRGRPGGRRPTPRRRPGRPGRPSTHGRHAQRGAQRPRRVGHRAVLLHHQHDVGGPAAARVDRGQLHVHPASPPREIRPLVRPRFAVPAAGCPQG